MKFAKYLALLPAALLLTACGAQTESAVESAEEDYVVLTESPSEMTETVTQPAPETVPATAAELTTEITTEQETAQSLTETASSSLERAEDEAPFLIVRGTHVWDGQTITAEAGGSADLADILSFGDDHDPHPTLTWEGSFDPNEPGDYPVTVTLTDNAGNTRQYDLTVAVPWEKMSVTVPFETILTSNPGCSCGIDVSKWQGDIDFDSVKAAGAEFVLMRIGYGDTGCDADPCFAQNFENSKAAGLQRGVYFYSTAASPEAARKQADWIANQLGGEALDLPVAFDWENFKHFQDWGMSFDTLNAIYDAFSEQMLSYGYETMLYAEPDTVGKAWYPGKTIWLADYGAAPEYTGDYFMRQACNYGRIDGISGDVDVNILPAT